MHRGNSSPFYGGFVKFCPRDAQAPSVPANVQVTEAGGTSTISWNASTDNFPAGSGIKYEILRDDATLGTVVTASQLTRSYAVPNLTAPTRFFVRAVDVQGNRSATTAAFTVAPAAQPLAPTRRRRRDVVVPGRRCRPGHRVAEPGHGRLLVGDRLGPARLGRR